MIEATTASNLHEAILQRLPMSLAAFALRARKFLLVCNADSATSCIKLSRFLGTLMPAVHAACRMHQLNIAMVATLKISGMMSSLFCGSLLFKRRRVKRLMRQKFLQHFQHHFRCEFGTKDMQAQRQVHACLDLLIDLVQYDKGLRGEPSAKLHSRHAAWARLRQSLSGPIRDAPVIRHRCQLGCHASATAACQEVAQDAIALWLQAPPTVPAWNKWNKVWQACVNKECSLIAYSFVFCSTYKAQPHKNL